jgi:hypothetical protein
MVVPALMMAVVAAQAAVADDDTPAPAFDVAHAVCVGANLVANGDFERADATDANRPDAWDRPDGLGVRWLEVPKDLDGARHGKALCMDTSVSEKAMMAQWAKVHITDWNIPKATGDPVAASYGLSLYSRAFPIHAGKYYRVSVLFHGSGAKIWVRGYALVDHHGITRHQRQYEALTELTASPKGWAVTTYDFNPTLHTPGVTEMKVMIFAYWPPGITWFDDVCVRELASAGSETGVGSGH